MRGLFSCCMLLLIFGCGQSEPGETGQTNLQQPDQGGGIEAALPGQGEDTGKTVLYRDTYGVAHIYAPDIASGLYAQGWAQAQDRPQQLLLNLKIAMGELSHINGEAGVPASMLSHMFGHMRHAAASLELMDEDARARMSAFAKGISDFYAAHPQDVPSWWDYDEVTPQMIDAFSRAFLYNWSIDEALSDLRRGGIEPDFLTQARASNQWAVAPSRSASGHAMLLIDPHLSWWGVSRFWEMRVHAGSWHGSGVGLAGSPYLGLGHNADVAWAMTTGGPDTADIFALQLDLQDPNRYRYDDEWRELQRHEVMLKFPDGQQKTYAWESSHHGPIVARTDTHAYAARTAYDTPTNRNEAWEALNFATSYEGAVEACATLAFFPQNILVADTGGNIYYQRTGRVPVRNPQFDWSRPVDGSTSASQWQGLHPATDHLQVLNPESGYLQNCNIPPDAMIPDSPFSLDAQPDYLFSSAVYGPARSGWTNQRGARAIELLSANDSMTVAQALDYAVDIQPFGHQRWLQALRQAQPPASSALQELLSWNGELHKDSTAALSYYLWRDALDEMPTAEQIREHIDDHYAVVEQRAARDMQLNEAQLQSLREAWQRGVARMEELFPDGPGTWGDMFRVGRDGKSWPVSGGGGDHLGLTTLRTMGYAEMDENNQRQGVRGQTSTQLVVLSKPIQSWLYLPVGQSDRPESPHYRDQAATVFSERTLKPSWWLPEDLAGHIESRTVLEPGL